MKTDILLDKEDDLLINGGDFVADQSDAQHVDLIIRATKGSIRHSPLTGVAAVDYKGALLANLGNLNREIQIQLEAEGYKYASVTVGKDNTLQVQL